MTGMDLSRRRFLTLAGSGLAVAMAAPLVEPSRRFWQVGRNAPVGARVQALTFHGYGLSAVVSDQTGGYGILVMPPSEELGAFGRAVSQMRENHERALDRMAEWSKLYEDHDPLGVVTKVDAKRRVITRG